jgi:transcriptional regulator with AAA-type ATPase domain
MSLLTDHERVMVQALSDLVYCNPFTPERIACERRALGGRYVDVGPVWSMAVGGGANVAPLGELAEGLVEALRQRLADGVKPTAGEWSLYEDLVMYCLYESQRPMLSAASEAALAGQRTPAPHAGWPRFIEGFNRLLQWPGAARRVEHDPAHVFACFFQIRRAFTNIYHYLVGSSAPAARLRATIWQSIFTHDLRRYYRGLFTRMADFTTLVTGESGTGKELVARAIGRSRYVPFHVQKGAFENDFATSFYAVNLAALSPTLIESELFGHQRGAFTGAVADRKGWLEMCPPRGTVFLDEIGELDGSLQVKLLRVLQTRTFERLGDTTTRRFDGKIIAATNRDLAHAMQVGRFRGDLYFRLCSDVIRTPSLREQLADRPGDLYAMVRFVAGQLVESDSDANALAGEITSWIESHLGREYAWPGNFRELEQCVRNVVVRGAYEPPSAPASRDDGDALAAAVQSSSLTADELLTRYVAMTHGREGSYEATARRLGLDRRTVKARVVKAGLMPG